MYIYYISIHGRFPILVLRCSLQYIYIYHWWDILTLTCFCYWHHFVNPLPPKKKLCVFCYHCWELYFCCSAKPGSAKPKEGPTPTDYPTMVPSDRSIGAIKEAPWTLDFFSGWWWCGIYFNILYQQSCWISETCFFCWTSWIFCWETVETHNLWFFVVFLIFLKVCLI